MKNAFPSFFSSHRNPAIRKTSAKYIYLVCEKLGPAKILSGTRDITERILQIAANFASDGPPEIRFVLIKDRLKTNELFFRTSDGTEKRFITC